MMDILNAWKLNTILIENEDGKPGTGFVIRRSFELDGLTRIKFFLVTCKHVLHDDLNRRQEMNEIVLYPPVNQFDGTYKREQLILPFDASWGKIWREHPDPEVDVLVIDVSQEFFNGTYFHDAPGLDFFGTPTQLEKIGLSINVGGDIAMVGFPDLKTDEGTRRPIESEPVVYVGTLATPFDKPYILQGKISVPEFFVNLSATPGASGSPILLRPGMPWISEGKTYLGRTTPALLLGVLAETRYAPVKLSRFEGHGFSGAGLAFSATTILETLSLFVQHE